MKYLCIYLQDVVKEVLAFAEMSGDAPVQPQPDTHDFPDLLSAPSPTSNARSPAMPNVTPPSTYRCDRVYYTTGRYIPQKPIKGLLFWLHAYHVQSASLQGCGAGLYARLVFKRAWL